jgi:SAM-dependent methyltransferase
MDAGLQVIHSTLSEYLPTHGAGRFDVACSFQVLEHIADPRAFLLESLACVRGGGFLIVSVPNANGYMRYASDLLDAPPHHVTRWPRRSLRHLATLFDLELIDRANEPLGSYKQAWTDAYLARIAQVPVVGGFARQPVTRRNLLRVLTRTPLGRMARGQSTVCVYRRR